MKKLSIALALSLMIQTTLLAQVTTPPTVKTSSVSLDPEKNELDRHLLRWEQEMAKVNSFAAQVTRSEKNPVFETTDHFKGTIHYLKPSYVLLHMAKKDNPNSYERFLCSPNFLYQYVPAQKEIHVYQTSNSAKPGAQKEDNSLSFLFGLKAKEAKRRYDLRLAKTDKYYIYVDIIPRRDVDKAEFQKARVVLNRDTMLPRQLWFQQPNKEEVLWDFPKMMTGVKLTKLNFQTPPKLPKGWKMKQKKLPTPQTRKPVFRNQN